MLARFPSKVRARDRMCGGRGGRISAPQPEGPDKRGHFPALVFVSSPLTFQAESSEAKGMFSAAAISCNWKRFVNISQRFCRVTLSCELQPPLVFRQKLQLSQGRRWSFPITDTLHNGTVLTSNSSLSKQRQVEGLCTAETSERDECHWRHYTTGGGGLFSSRSDIFFSCGC